MLEWRATRAGVLISVEPEALFLQSLAGCIDDSKLLMRAWWLVMSLKILWQVWARTRYEPTPHELKAHRFARRARPIL